MIDTDEYERILKDDDGRNNVLALDLLAEVKRLRKGVKTLYEYLDAVITYEDEDILLGIKGALKVMIE
tara:strand:- start:590 stop:793 length:204 start_codon:yes stop_codon:yes gene_type:complete